MEKQPENEKETQAMKETRRVTSTNTATRFKKADNPFDYRCVPSDADANTQTLLAKTTEDLRREYSKVLEKWLEGCVRKFCPEASRAFDEGKPVTASTILNSAGYYYATNPDGTVNFMVGDTVLAKCKIEINFTANKVAIEKS